MRLSNFVLTFFFIFFYSNNAFAYIDPGTGGILIQALLAAFAAVSAFISLYWKKFKELINKIFKNKKRD